MSLESFYGGKQGLSSIIKKSFKYISNIDPAFTILNSEEQAEAITNDEVMATCLSNPDYKDVWYGELCLIDTTNKSNPYNGYLYRRTLAKTGSEDPSSTSGTKLPAEYIGQIVGPAGPALQLESLQSIDEAVAAFNAIPTGTKVTYTDSTGNIHYEKNSSTAALGVLPITINGEFIAGNTTATTSSGYVESGKYTWYNINSGDRSELYLGFQLPYQVNELTAGRTLAPNATPAIRTVTAAPFYNQYAIDTPRGFRGGWISNLRQHTVSGAETYFNLSGLVYNANNDSWSVTNASVTTPTPGWSIWLANFKYQVLGQNNNLTEQEISNLFVSNSAIVTREGLYVQSSVNTTMTVSSSVVTDDQIENHINNNNILNNAEQDKAQIVTITFSDSAVESRIFYYNSSQNKWKLLAAGGAGGGPANTTDVQINVSNFPNSKLLDDDSGIVFSTQTFSTTSLPTAAPWK